MKFKIEDILTPDFELNYPQSYRDIKNGVEIMGRSSVNTAYIDIDMRDFCKVCLDGMETGPHSNLEVIALLGKSLGNPARRFESCLLCGFNLRKKVSTRKNVIVSPIINLIYIVKQ